MVDPIFVLIAITTPPTFILLALVAVAATVDPVYEANKSAFITEIVSKEDYGDAIKLAATSGQVSQLLGYAVGGVVIAFLGVRTTLFLNGATFLLSALTLYLIPAVAVVGGSKAVPPSLANAIKFLRDDPLSFYALSLSVATIVFANSIESQAAVYGSVIGGLSPKGIGLLAAIVPAATMLGIFTINSKEDDQTLVDQGTYVTAAVAVIATVVFLFTGWFTTFLGFALTGLLFVFASIGNIVVGRRIPDDSRASIFAVLQTAIFLSMSFGALFGGFLASLVGSQAAAVAATIGIILSILGLKIPNESIKEFFVTMNPARK